VFGVATALARGLEQLAAIPEQNWEIASHGLKWIDCRTIPRDVEQLHLREAIALHTSLTGAAPLGFCLGRCSTNTRELVITEPNVLYSSDSYTDDLPYWVASPSGPHLVIPYTLDANDMRLFTVSGFASGDDFFAYLRGSFGLLLREGRNGQPKLLNVGLHCRLAGRPGRAALLARFLDHVQSHDDVWIVRWIGSARHWHTFHPPQS